MEEEEWNTIVHCLFAPWVYSDVLATVVKVPVSRIVTRIDHDLVCLPWVEYRDPDGPEMGWIPRISSALKQQIPDNRMEHG